MGTSPAVSSGGPAWGGRDHQGRQAGCSGWEGLMEPLESILRVPGKDRTHLAAISPVVLESSVWSRDPTPPAPGRAPRAQLSKCGIDQLAAGLLSLSFQQELGLNGNNRERGSHACNLCFPRRSMLPATQGRCLRSAGPPLPAPAGI